MLLAIETSSLVSSVALLHDDTLRAELTIQARLTHSEQLMPHIADMLDKASVKKSQIDGVAVAVGPGSFTGLRIGLATAKGLAFAWNVPIVGVTTPVSLAWNFVGVSDRICTLIDAQKGNVYAGVYRWDRTTLTTEKEIYIAPRTEVLDTLEREGQPVVFCGDGSLKGRRDIEGRSPLFRMAPPTGSTSRPARRADGRRRETSECTHFAPETISSSLALLDVTARRSRRSGVSSRRGYVLRRSWP